MTKTKTQRIGFCQLFDWLQHGTKTSKCCSTTPLPPRKRSKIYILIFYSPSRARSLKAMCIRSTLASPEPSWTARRIQTGRGDPGSWGRKMARPLGLSEDTMTTGRVRQGRSTPGWLESVIGLSRTGCRGCRFWVRGGRMRQASWQVIRWIAFSNSIVQDSFDWINFSFEGVAASRPMTGGGVKGQLVQTSNSEVHFSSWNAKDNREQKLDHHSDHESRTIFVGRSSNASHQQTPPVTHWNSVRLVYTLLNTFCNYSM